MTDRFDFAASLLGLNTEPENYWMKKLREMFAPFIDVNPVAEWQCPECGINVPVFWNKCQVCGFELPIG